MSYVGKVTDTAGNTHLVGSTLYGTCDTSISVATKQVVCPDFDKLETGVTIHVKFDAANTAVSPKLKVGNTDAKPILGTTGAISGVSKWSAGAIVSFTYDGQYWCMNDVYFVDTDTKNTAGATPSAGSDPLYIIGAKTQSANPQTYTQAQVMMENGGLIADSYNDIEISHPVSDGFWLQFKYGTGTPYYLRVPVNKRYSLGDACAKGVDTSTTGISSSSTDNKVPTSLAVYNAIQNAITGVAEYQGSVSAESALLNQALTKGWYYVVAMPTTTPPTTSITIGGKTCEAGDMVWIRDSGTYTTSADLGDHIDIIQSNIDTLTTAEIDALWAAA